MKNHDMLAPRVPAALEYWYFKVNCGSIALIVDWIERRKKKEHMLRVSMHSGPLHTVRFKQLQSFMPADNFLNKDKTAGHLDEIKWDLEIDLGTDRIKPDLFPAGLLHLPDLLTISAPHATFTGFIEKGSETIWLEKVPGMVSHYWGRQLASEWWWISAHQFDQPDMAVECCALKSGMWGLPLSIPIAYLYLKYQGKSRFVMAPFQFAHAEGTTEKFSITIRQIGHKPVMLKCTGRDYGNFGDNIINTLVGDLEVWVGEKCIGVANGTAGLERLFPHGELIAALQ